MCLAILAGVYLFSSFASTAVLVPPSSLPEKIVPPPQTLPSLFIPGNITNTPSPNSKPLRIHCDGTVYGRNLNPSSCRGVFHYLARSDEQSTFSERHTGRPNDVPLPMRFLSNDGLCFVQPLLLHGAVTGQASSAEIGEAAYTLFQTCVVEKGIGGIAADIGASVFLQICLVLRIFKWEIHRPF